MKYLRVFCLLLLAGCASQEVQEASYKVDGREQVADDKGWYHFAGFEYNGRLAKGKPHGAGKCRETWEGRGYGPVEPCEFNQGVRIDQNYLKSTKDEIVSNEDYRRKQQQEAERQNAIRAAEYREQQKESDRAMRETFTNLNKDMAAFSANLAAQDRETNRLVEQAQREKQAKREAEQHARENEQLEARRERVMRERAALDRQGEERRQAHVQQQEQANQQAKADTQSAALVKRQAELAKQQVEQRDRERKAAEDARMAKAAEQERKQEQERKKAEAAAAKQAEARAEKEAKARYLKSVAAATRLAATKCPDGEGKYYATGSRPSIKPEVVPCVDIHFRAYCPGSTQGIGGIIHNFAVWGGCFGETAEINPKPGCKVNEVRIEVVEARTCGG